MIPPAIRLCVDWMHIRQAERQAAATGSRALTPVGLALVEQTRFAAAQVAPDCIVLVDGLTHAEVRYAANPELSAYLARYQRGEPVQPATFTLTLAVG